MLNLMYDIPSSDNVDKILITKKMIIGNNDPEIIYKEDEEKSA